MAMDRRQFHKWMLSAAPLGALQAFQIRPKLLVLVLLEQVRTDVLDSLSPQFTSGGLRKLLFKGAQFADCRHLASTFSPTAVTSLATGAWPNQHGIVADSWYDRGSNTAVPASSEALLAGTLCSEIMSAHHTRCYVIGTTGPLAALFAGNWRVSQFWRNPRGQFATLGEPPKWLVDFNANKSLDSAHNARWFALDARPGAPPLRTLVYDPDRPAEFLNLYLGSPLADEAQFDLLSLLIEQEKLGQKDTTDFVCLMVGASAKLGYETGGADPLQRELLLQFDRQMENLLNHLGRTPGEGAFSVVFAGAHGAPAAPEAETRARMAVAGESVAQAVDRVLQATSSGRVRRYQYPFLHLDPILTRDPEAVRVAAGRAAMEHPAVAGFYTAGGACSVGDPWRRRYRNSFQLRRSGDVMLSYKPGYVEDYGQGRGISYGSLYNYDVRVPLCFYGPPFRTGIYTGAVESVDLAPTLAHVLGLAEPASAEGRVLTEALAA
jgi:hypothetical protein